jgi:hypothetical protein
MTKIPLLNHIIRLKVFTDVGSDAKAIEIKNGVYENLQYTSLVILGDTIIIDGDEPIILVDRVKMTDLKILSAVDMIAEALNDDSAYIYKTDAIPEGREREILRAITELP